MHCQLDKALPPQQCPTETVQQNRVTATVVAMDMDIEQTGRKKRKRRKEKGNGLECTVLTQSSIVELRVLVEPTVSQSAVVIRQIACHLGQHSTIVFLASHVSGLGCYCESQVASLLSRGHNSEVIAICVRGALVTRPGKSSKVKRVCVCMGGRVSGGGGGGRGSTHMEFLLTQVHTIGIVVH